MKDIFLIDDTPVNRISYYLLLAFFALLPFDRLYSELSLIGLGVHTLIHMRKGLRWSVWWGGWAVAGLFLLTVISTVYAPSSGKAFPEWEKQLALVIFPLIFWISPMDWQRYRPRLMKAFAFSCTLTALFLYKITLVKIYALHLPWMSLFTMPFMNHSFTEAIDLHATYYSAYLALSLVVLADLVLRGEEGPAAKAIYVGASVVCLAAILQLASRAVGIGVLVILNFIIPFRMMRGRMRPVSFGLMFLLTIVALLGVSRNRHLHSRYLLQLKQELHTDTGAVEDPEPRMARWQCAWELIQARPWTGYGAGTEADKLKEKYLAKRLMISYTYGLNAHNQFLSWWIKAGVPGVTWYIFLLGMGFMNALRRRDHLLLSYMVIILCVSFAENLLDVNKGIFFFAAFFVFFMPKPVSDRIFTHGNKNTGSTLGARARRYYRLLP